jgi:hypothetical protein
VGQLDKACAEEAIAMPALAVPIRIGVTLALVLTVAGCSGSGSKSSSSAGFAAGTTAAAGGFAAAALAPATAAAPTAAANADRAVVRTATMSVQVTDVDATANKVEALASEPGERVDGDQRDSVGRGRTAQLILRVQPQRLNAVITAVDAMGKETARTVTGQDVTATKATDDASVTSLTASVTRLREFLAKSATLNSLLAVERTLTEREGELQAAQTQQRALDDTVALASLTVSLSHPPAAVVVVKKHHAGPAGFGTAIHSGWHGLTTTLEWLVAGVGYVLPIGLPMLLLAAVGVLVRRRFNHRPVPSTGTDA